MGASEYAGVLITIYVTISPPKVKNAKEEGGGNYLCKHTCETIVSFCCWILVLFTFTHHSGPATGVCELQVRTRVLYPLYRIYKGKSEERKCFHY